MNYMDFCHFLITQICFFKAQNMIKTKILTVLGPYRSEKYSCQESATPRDLKESKTHPEKLRNISKRDGNKEK